MTESSIRELLEAVASGRQSIEQAVGLLRRLPFEDLGFAKVDHHRSIRCGFPEVIFCEGKAPQQVAAIFERCAQSGVNVLATRADRVTYEAVAERIPQSQYHELARMITLRQCEGEGGAGTILVVSAGTSDMPVAEEARITADMMGQATKAIYDVGVAGIHRLLAHSGVLQEASVIVAVAGMEGALPSVVGGLVDCPVIAVPTSVGYGASFGGVTALLAMLNSCASGVTVVNIDNGFGAGFAAALMNRMGGRKKTAEV